MSEAGNIIVTGLVGLMFFLAGCTVGANIGERAERRRAVEAGVGRYVVDKDSGTVTFEYGRE
jgi:hypothetical protein